MPSTQLTLRNVDAELLRRLRAISAARGESLDHTVVAILQQAVGTDARRERLRRYATWTERDLKEFNAVLEEQRTVDSTAFEA